MWALVDCLSNVEYLELDDSDFKLAFSSICYLTFGSTLAYYHSSSARHKFDGSIEAFTRFSET